MSYHFILWFSVTRHAVAGRTETGIESQGLCIKKKKPQQPWIKF